jgi:hypothetical protein
MNRPHLAEFASRLGDLVEGELTVQRLRRIA